MKSLRRPFPAFAAFVFVLLFAGPKLVFAAQYDQRLANLSTRGQIGTGANIMITGFVVCGMGTKAVSADSGVGCWR